jgi:hypothetical protein
MIFLPYFREMGSYGEPQEDGPPICAAYKFSLREHYIE